MPINTLYHTPHFNGSGTATEAADHPSTEICLVLYRIFQSRSVLLSRIAGKFPGQENSVSTTRRLSRLLASPAIDDYEWYAPIAREWVTSQAKTG